MIYPCLLFHWDWWWDGHVWDSLVGDGLVWDGQERGSEGWYEKRLEGEEWNGEWWEELNWIEYIYFFKYKSTLSNHYTYIC